MVLVSNFSFSLFILPLGIKRKVVNFVYFVIVSSVNAFTDPSFMDDSFPRLNYFPDDGIFFIRYNVTCGGDNSGQSKSLKAHP